ncbi:unnamed protein product [Tetraodon nigroviridis]|uniref:(spotted green pufferfish) hypothetical protein n=1 Tax=Tetraodon nigroviridis TaxID=99883 RepID=Q4SD00_TETNG|nr:unnamed protein product [Tetraodon nigroviridis]
MSPFAEPSHTQLGRAAPAFMLNSSLQGSGRPFCMLNIQLVRSVCVE